MTKLEFFESGLGLVGVKLGIVSVELLVKYNAYKVYLELLPAHSQSEAKDMAAKKCKCDERTMRRYIRFFEQGEQDSEIVRSGNRWHSKANTCLPNTA